MNNKYCLPIIKNKKDEIVEIIRSHKNDYGYFEVWLDYVDDLNEAFLRQLVELLHEKGIVVFRRQHLEKVTMNPEKRRQIISFLENPALLIDLDIFDQRDELEYVKKARLKVNTIISYHNYEKTPDDTTLREIIDMMSEYEPAIYKIATRCGDESDALRLLQLLIELKERKLKCIILGMGEMGIVTRIFGTLWGNEMIFAPKTTTEQSAPGQLTRDQLETIFKELYH